MIACYEVVVSTKTIKFADHGRNVINVLDHRDKSAKNRNDASNELASYISFVHYS